MDEDVYLKFAAATMRRLREDPGSDPCPALLGGCVTGGDTRTRLPISRVVADLGIEARIHRPTARRDGSIDFAPLVTLSGDCGAPSR
ncbi:hypothetical protein [Thermomonospora umbrina]|uniref:hypothetical protein n=1 Tax=Thermomonospora umbrina TaxID=111806 RepID=UPI000E22C4F8|nr:hypothetical protein [Thermomonospora umbrina]